MVSGPAGKVFAGSRGPDADGAGRRLAEAEIRLHGPRRAKAHDQIAQIIAI